MGDITQNKKEVSYRRPLPENVEGRVVRPHEHQNMPEIEYAVDFLVEEETPVLAARDGVVVKIKEDSDKWGLDREFAKQANFVVVRHEDGTFAEYVHLGKDTVEVEQGQKVKQGDRLARTGFSGLMDTPHLHFNVFKIEDGKAVSVPVKIVEH